VRIAEQQTLLLAEGKNTETNRVNGEPAAAGDKSAASTKSEE